MNDEDSPEDRLDKLLRAQRRKTAFKLGSVGTAFLALLIFVFVIEREAQGPERSTVLSRSQTPSDDSVTIDYRVSMPSGQIFVLRARPIVGVNTGTEICVQRLRHPVFGGETLQRLPNSRCDLP